MTQTTAGVLAGPLLTDCCAFVPEAASRWPQSMQEKYDEIEHQAHHGSYRHCDVDRGRSGLQA
jgi:hypothetical protein